MSKFALQNIEAEKIYFYMNEVANNRTPPNTKFKDVTPDKEKVKEYEFKDGDLRVYGISKFGGKIIIMGGYKNRQKKDYRTFRSLKEQYLSQETNNTTNNETSRTPKK